VAGALRSKITASWIFIPVLAVAIYLSVYRWLRLR
jgi:phosphate/sulfate permease